MGVKAVDRDVNYWNDTSNVGHTEYVCVYTPGLG
jgi:hypothetical protein